jgi:hypothetical protein
MSKPLSLNDFRAVRVVLEPPVFAWGPETEPSPSDLIDKETWHGGMCQGVDSVGEFFRA